jgi:dienelactone hydrolase
VSRWPERWRRWAAAGAVVLALGLGPGTLRATEIVIATRLPLVIPRVPSVPLNETLLHIPVTVAVPGGVRRVSLEATFYRPDGPGPFPLVVMSHGTPRDPRQRQVGRLRYDAQSWKFVSMGFAVVIPMRRGYGHSEGKYAESEGTCENADFAAAGRESARDLRATVEYVAARPDIDPDRLVLVGHSSGGFASLILASQGLPGVRGVINFAGGRGSKADLNCSPGKLVEACGLAGRSTRAPTLWVYAENDSYFPPRLARQMSLAFLRAGGQAEVVMLPPFLEEGHFLFSDVRGLAQWTPVVNRFLNDLGFPGQMPRP